jgi:cyanophycinase
VLAGSSAGAMIQGSFLLNFTRTPSDLRFSRNSMYLDPAREKGFALLQSVAVYPHIDGRHSQKDLMELIAHDPELVGIGIDENTAIILHDDQFEVIGVGTASVFDKESVARKKYVTVLKGQKYDLRGRTIMR